MPARSPRPATKPPATAMRAFLFSDLRGYTAFVESHGDAAAAGLLKEYRGLVRREVAKHKGAEVKTEGDSFYVVFTSPSAALDCAVAILRKVEARNAKEPGHPLRVGLGLHAGETVEFDDQFVGSAVNVAARLTAKAEAGELIVSDTCRGLVRTATSHAMTEQGALRLKGVSERIRAWKVEWREDVPPAAPEAPAQLSALLSPSAPAGPAGPAPGQLVSPVMIGREAEAARLTEILSLAQAGQGQAVLLAGEAGVGKSAIVRAAQEAASARGFRLLYGATMESDGGLPYAPFVAAVRSGFRGLDRDRLGRVLAQTAPDLAQLFPELGRDAREPTSAEQQRVSVAFHGLFTAFAREAPVLLVVEDLHWADEASLGLLHYLARELRDTRIALLASYRSDEMHRRHPLLRAIAAMQRERLISEVALGRLSREKVGELVRAVFIRTDPNIRVSDEFRDAIYARSEGNPFFTEELLKALVESGDLVYAADRGWNRTKPIEQLSIPGSVREAVRARTEKLSPDAQQTLSAASVIGLRFRFELLRAIRGSGETELEAHLREFIEQQLAVELGGPADEYGFRHALTREVVYDDLLVRERKRLHRSVAEALGREATAEPALLAHHLVAAGETAAAVPHLLEAAARAERAFAPREAVVHYERALEIGVPDEQVAGILERVAEACYLFDFARSRKAAEEAAGEFRARGDRHGLSRMLRLASRDAWQQADASRARTLAQEAIQALDGLDDSVELGRAVANLAGLRMIARADEEAIAVAERALELGERFADAWTVANALITKGTALNNMGRSDEGRAILRRGLDLAIAEGLAEVAVRAYNNLMIRADLHVDERRRLVDEGLEYGRRHGLEQPMLATAKCFIALGRGDWDEALAIAERVAEGSFWFGELIVLRNIIVLGRSGPEAALSQAEQRAAGSAEHPEAQAMAGPLAWAATVRVFTGDTAGASRWLALIERRAAEDPGLARMLAAGTTPLMWFVSLAAAACDAPGWRERIEAALPADPAARVMTEAALDCADGLVTGDPDRTARALAALQTHNAYRGSGAMPDLVILAGRDALRRGLRLGPAWLAIIETARAYSQRAEAGWLLSELDRLEGEVATS